MTIISFIAGLLAYPLVPIAVLFANEEGRLPFGFRWLETHDALGWGAGTYEPEVGAAYAKYGKRIALTYWLWRNKAYTLRHGWRANPNYDTMQMYQSGVTIPPRKGFFYWYGKITDGDKSWFEFQVGISLIKFHIYARGGWKLKPYFDGHRPENIDTTATGMFVGITLRSDDWDDFPE